MRKQNWISVFVAILILSGLVFSCTENYTSKYDTYNDLIKSGDLSKGWIPLIIPSNSKSINELHNIDNNRVFGCFDFSDFSNIDLLAKNNIMQSVDSVINNLKQTKRPKQPDWFISGRSLMNLKPVIFKYDDFYIICDTTNKKGYFLR